MHIGGRTMARLHEDETGATYHSFNPPRRPEQYAGQPGPHNGLALTWDVIRAMSESRVSGKPHGYLVQGEWVRRDGVRFLDIAVDRAWVTENTNNQVVDGKLRWVCPGCGRLSGMHNKGCDYR